MSDADYVLMTVEYPGDSPTIKDIAKVLSVAAEAIDSAFGVVVVDPGRHLYAVQIKASAITGAPQRAPYRGPFSNPRIEPMRPKDKVKRRR